MQVSFKCNITYNVEVRTLFWWCCIRGMFLEGHTHQTSAQLPLTFKHLSHHGNKACVPSQEKLMCLQPKGDSLLCIGICRKLLASQVLLMGFEEMELTTGPHTANALVTVYVAMARRLWMILPTSLISDRVISISVLKESLCICQWQLLVIPVACIVLLVSKSCVSPMVKRILLNTCSGSQCYNIKTEMQEGGHVRTELFSWLTRICIFIYICVCNIKVVTCIEFTWFLLLTVTSQI